jgi:enamine deaminase RidA (YjgF/YER057c/UK114 family)
VHCRIRTGPQLPRRLRSDLTVGGGSDRYTSGATDPSTEAIITGKVGGDLTLEQWRQAAHLAALSILATLQAQIGLDRIEWIEKVFGSVNVAPAFNQTPAMIDGCSNLLVQVFGEAGRHSRSAVGLAELPFDIAVETELVAPLVA